MKKNIIFLFLLLFIIISCKKSQAEEKAIIVPDEIKPIKYVGNFGDERYGYPSIKIKTKNGLVIYFDPMNKNETEKADFIFITHGHTDHVSTQVINNLQKENTVLFLTSDVKNRFKKRFKDGSTMITIEPGKKYSTNGIIINTVHAYNLVENRKWHSKLMNYVGYIIEFDNLKYYISGDTDVVPEMNNINADVTFLAVDKDRSQFFMHSNEAAEFVNNKLKTKYLIPYHYPDNIETELVKLINKSIKCILFKEDKIISIIN